MTNPDSPLKSEIFNLKLLSAERLREFCARVFAHHGVPQKDAEKAADVLVTSDLRGIDSHGVARLTFYHDFLATGRLNPRPNIQIVRESPSTSRLPACAGGGRIEIDSSQQPVVIWQPDLS